MKKLTPDSPEAKSLDLVQENIAKLKALFPQLLTEAKDGAAVNVDVLKQLVGDATVTDAEEKYGLNWNGKRKARLEALKPSTGTLRPAKADSVEWDSTQHLLIEGDNLEVLKLLRKSYANQVKLIYIDPPYNTGSDFVYPDDYQDNLKNYKERLGTLGQQANPEANGRFHTDWLNMITPRIAIARELLTSDGAMFVSCDENEQARLRLVMDELIGPENFIADMIWAAGRKNDSRLISVSHEYIVCYARDIGRLKELKTEWHLKKKGLDEIYAAYKKIKKEFGQDYAAMTAAMKAWYKALPDSAPAKAHKHYAHIDSRGVFFPDNISWPGGGGPKYEVLHPATKMPVAVPSRGWLFSDPKKMQELIDDDRVVFGVDETGVPAIKSYLTDRERQAPYSVFYQDGRAATKRLRELMGGEIFDFPKDEQVIREIVEMLTQGNDVVVDFFAGSGTTGHAVMAQNAADGGNRRYILVQLPEPLDPAKKEQKTAADFCDQLGVPRTIAELTKERLRRAAKKVKAENPLFHGDLGFRVFKLDSSNLKAWDPHTANLPQSLLDAAEHVKPDRTTDDLLYELLLKKGLDLAVPMEQKTIAGKDVVAIGGGVMLVCLADAIDATTAEPLAMGLAAWHKQLAPANDKETVVIFKDSAFDSNVAKSNLAEILKQRGLEKVNSI